MSGAGGVAVTTDSVITGAWGGGATVTGGGIGRSSMISSSNL
jgi:hypothetical protein